MAVVLERQQKISKKRLEREGERETVDCVLLEEGISLFSSMVWHFGLSLPAPFSSSSTEEILSMMDSRPRSCGQPGPISSLIFAKYRMSGHEEEQKKPERSQMKSLQRRGERRLSNSHVAFAAASAAPFWTCSECLMTST